MFILRLSLRGFFLWWIEVFLLIFLDNFGWKSIYWLLEWQCQLASWDHLLGRTFSSLFVWGSDCICYLFLECKEMLDLVLISSLLALCSFIDEFSSLILKNIKDRWLVVPVMFGFCSWHYVHEVLSFWLFKKMIIILFFSLWCMYPPCAGIFLLESSVGLYW